MATYTKETALYDTGAIANDIGEAGETASKYITAVDQNGIKVHAENNTNVNYTVINAEGMEVYDDSVSVAKFGAVTRIGTEDDASITIDDTSIVGTGEDGKKFFNFANSDVSIVTNHTSGIHTKLNEYPTTQATAKEVSVDFDPSTIEIWSKRPHQSYLTKLGESSFGTSLTKTVSFELGGTSYVVSVSYDGARTFKTWLNTSSQRSEDVYIEYRLKKVALAPSYELGGGTATGGYSLSEGFDTSASGNYSHAEGYHTEASAIYSHAEGQYSKASNWWTHAEGCQTTASGNYASHAEGYKTTASGNSAHSEGNDTIASGAYSHAQNAGTIAAGGFQTAIGKYNVSDTTSAFIIGKGTENSARSNALTVDWSGNVNIASGAKYKINGTDLSAANVGAVPTTRTVNSKALSADITLSASDVGAVPTTRTVNSKALSSDISLTASDVGAVPTTRTVNSKALSADITLSASDVSAVPTTRTVNSKALSADISLSASDVGAVPTTRTVNGKALSSNVADADYVTAVGTSGSWTYRKWNSGKIEAWCGYTFASAASTAWTSPIRYWDKSINIPSGIFSTAPRLIVSSQSNQYWVGGASASSATAGTVRVLTVATSAMAVNLSIYAVSG